MTYAFGGLIQATDYNGFVASVNAIWGTGSGDTGYGQSNLLTTVSASSIITATQWNNLIGRINTIRQHQSGSASTIVNPAAGTQIAHQSILSSTIATITSNRSITASPTALPASTVSASTNGFATYTKEITVTWANPTSMRYWFNAGGSIGFTGLNSELTANAVSTEWDTLLSNCGTVYIAGRSSSRANGTGTATINTNLGFHNLTTSYQTILDQSRIGSGYNVKAEFQAKLNASPGSATVLTVRIVLTNVIWSIFSGTLRFDVLPYAPSTTYLTDTWGSITVNTSISPTIDDSGYSSPLVVGTATNELNNGASSHPVNLPSGNIDDLLVILLVTDSASTFTNPTGWTQLYWTARSSSKPSVLISYRRATGSEGSTVNVAAGGSGGSPGGVNIGVRIRGGDISVAPQIGIFAASTTASPNPPSLTPSFAAGQHLWLAAGLWSGSTGNISSYPSGYTLGQAFRKNSRNSSTAWSTAALAAKQNTVLTEDPGAITISAASIALGATIAVKGL